MTLSTDSPTRCQTCRFKGTEDKTELPTTRRHHPHGSTFGHCAPYPRDDGPCRGFQSGRRSLPRLLCCAAGIRWPWPCTQEHTSVPTEDQDTQTSPQCRKHFRPPSKTRTSPPAPGDALHLAALIIHSDAISRRNRRAFLTTAKSTWEKSVLNASISFFPPVLFQKAFIWEF